MVKPNGKVLFILLDAFRHDYINPVDTPFLFAAAQRGVYAKKLKSTTGFTQRTAVLTGSMGLASGMDRQGAGSVETRGGDPGRHDYSDAGLST